MTTAAGRSSLSEGSGSDHRQSIEVAAGLAHQPLHEPRLGSTGGEPALGGGVAEAVRPEPGDAGPFPLRYPTTTPQPLSSWIRPDSVRTGHGKPLGPVWR